MSVLVLASASGAPGVTTTALGLALNWPGDSVLVDADRAASQGVLAGYLSGEAHHGAGLQGVLQAHRERRPMDAALASEWRPLPELPRGPKEGPGGERRFLPGFSHLGSVDLFDLVWPGVLDAARGAPYDVLVDAGRTGHHGLPNSLVAGADAVGLVCRTSLASLAALRLHLPPLLEAGAPGRVGLILVGPGRPYAAREVAEQFGVGVLAEIAWDPAAAVELNEGPVGRGWLRTALARSLRQAADRLAADQVAAFVSPDTGVQARA